MTEADSRTVVGILVLNHGTQKQKIPGELTARRDAPKLEKLFACRGSSLVERRPEKAGVASSILAPGTRFCCFFAQGLRPSISTLRLNLSRAILGRGSNKPERRHRGPPLLLWTAGHRLIKPMSSHAIRARMTPKHSPQLE